MATTENFVQVLPNSTGAKVQTVQLTDANSNTVERQVMVLGDPATDANIASVTSAGALKVDGSAATQPVSISGTVSVSGTFWQATQPVSWSGQSIAVSALPALPAGANAIGSVSVSNFPSSQAVTGSFWQATQPVSLVSLPALAAGSATIGAISNTSFAATQSGSWTVSLSAGLPAGANTIGAISNTAFGISGMLPAFAATPTVNIGTNAYPQSLNTGQASVGTTATLIVPFRAGRQSVTIYQEGTTLVRIGGSSSVTTSNGIPLAGQAYSSITLNTGSAIYGIVASGSQNVSFVEVF